MIEFEEISFSQLKPLVELGFSGDEKLRNVYEPEKTDFETMVQRNMDNVNDAREVYDLSFYKVKWEDEPIGFTVVGKKMGLLSSFGINIKWRKTEIVKAWYRKVYELLDGKIVCVLWNENVRAIRFLERSGMRISNRIAGATTLRK